MNDADIAWSLLQARQGVTRAYVLLEELAKTKSSYKSLRNETRTVLNLLLEAEEAL